MTKTTLGTLKCIISHVAVKFLELKFEKDAFSWQSQALCDHYYLYVFFSAKLCKKYQAKFHETWWSSGTWGEKILDIQFAWNCKIYHWPLFPLRSHVVIVNSAVGPQTKRVMRWNFTTDFELILLFELQ